jgi:hypothetical protein
MSDLYLILEEQTLVGYKMLSMSHLYQISMVTDSIEFHVRRILYIDWTISA